MGVIKDWDSRWFAKDNAFGDILVEDYKLRKFLKKTLYDAGVPKHRDRARLPPRSASTSTAPSPGMVIGKGGAEIEKIRRSARR